MNPILLVAGKELKEMLRDKRVRTSAFFGPVVLIFVMMSLMGFIFGQIGKQENTKVHVMNGDNPFAKVLSAAHFQVVPVSSVDEGKKLIENGSARVFLVFPKTVGTSGQINVDAYIDPKNQTGMIAMTLVTAAIDATNKEALKVALRDAGIPESTMEAIKVNRHDLQVGEKKGASDFLVGLLPYFIVIWAFYGGMSIASDMVAGEKEKYTLETLLISPVKRTQIVLGKFLALSTVCLASSMSSLVGLMLLTINPMPGVHDLFKGGLGISFGSLLLILAIMLPMVALFASLLLGISSYAKNAREAQTFLTQASFVVILPAIFSQFIGFTDYAHAEWVNVVPVLNAANNIRLALLGKADLGGAAITIGVSLVLASIALATTVRLFNREQVLVRV